MLIPTRPPKRLPKNKQDFSDEHLPLLGIALNSCLGEGEDWAKARAYKCVIGVDEVGRGPLAGPVVAGAVYMSSKLGEDLVEAGLNDSKRLSPGRREELARRINNEAVVGIAEIDASRIDEINILRATFEAMTKAVLSLIAHLPKDLEPDLLLIDGNSPITPHPLKGVRQHTLIKGDTRSISIAAASVVAKVYRDELMRYWDGVYPVYGFGKHKGYASSMHIEALMKFGPSPIHRRSFRWTPKAKTQKSKE